MIQLNTNSFEGEYGMTKERLRWIDIAKGICMLAVVVGHLHTKDFEFLYSFHLTVFFILSGYTMKKTPLTGDFLKSKFKRLMVPFFVTCGAVTVMEIVNSVVIARDCTIITATRLIHKNLLRGFFASGGQSHFGSIDFGKGIGAIWFLPALFFSLIFTQFLLNKLKTRKLQFGAAVLVALVAAVCARAVWLPFSILAGAFAVPFILFGFVLKEQEIIEKVLKWWHYLVFAVLFAIGCYFNLAQTFFMVSCSMKDWFFTPLCAILSSLAVIGISKLIGRFAPLEFVGKNSLIFLCVHLFEMNTLSNYYIKLRELLHLPDNIYITLVIRLVFITVVSSVIVWLTGLKKKSNRLTAVSSGKRDMSIDIMRALLIITMIIGHFPIFRGLRDIIYSFHMLAFVTVSGYFHKSGIPFGQSLKRAFKTLLPYGAFAVLYIIFTHNGFLKEIVTVLAGMSYSKNFLTELPSVGPVYFILLLFFVKVLYALVELCHKEWARHILVVSLLALSVLLGKLGWWLPWSLDCAMFSVAVYHIAYYMKKYELLKKINNMPYAYFPLACIWGYAVHAGPMELSVRRYGNVGLTVAGALSAFLVVYLLCGYLFKKLPHFVTKVLGLIGQSTAYILVLHTLFGTKSNMFLHNTLGLDVKNIFNLAVTITLQISVSVLLFVAVSAIKKRIKRRFLPTVEL